VESDRFSEMRSKPLLAMMSTSPMWRLAPSRVLSTLAGVLAAAHRKPFFEP